jgi:hypothetical protein
MGAFMHTKLIASRGLLIGVMVSLGGCTTFSFAPPKVQTEFKAARVQTLCGTQAASDTEIIKNFRGARLLIDNFTAAYRCSVQEAADGRQIFEVPSFLALVAAAIGPSFGLANEGRIAAIGSAAVYGRANNYYAPREKLPALDAALDAVLCVKTESIGVAFFDTRQGDVEKVRAAIAAAQGKIDALSAALVSLEVKRGNAVIELGKLAQSADSSAAARAALVEELKITDIAIKATQTDLASLEEALVAIADSSTSQIAAAAPMGIVGVQDVGAVSSANEQYFEMVSGALLSIERILGQRLKSAGKYDAAGLQAEIAKAIGDVQTADSMTTTPRIASMPLAEQGDEVQLHINAIQPRLQNCVIRAKLG